jgi:hypothetical protein
MIRMMMTMMRMMVMMMMMMATKQLQDVPCVHNTEKISLLATKH